MTQRHVRECVFVRLRRLLFVWIALIAGLSSTALAQKGSGSLHGIVIVPTGSPVPGASVSVEGKAGAQAATTDANGEYNINGLDSGDYHVKIAALGFNSFEVDVTVSGSLVKEVDAVLMSTPKPALPAAGPSEAPGTAAPAPGETQGQAPAAQTTVAMPQGFSVTPQKGKAAVYGSVADQ